MSHRFRYLATAAVIAGVLVSVGALLGALGVVGVSAQDSPTETPITQDVLSTAELLVPEVLNTFPHDTTAYTQGLLLHEGRFYESTGQRGESTLREVDPETGEVLRLVNLPDQLFGEGLALVDNRLIQITWTSQQVRFYHLDTFTLLATDTYVGQGWGLCYDGEFVWMTSGSDNLYKRDPLTFELLETIPVTLEGQPQDNLNELECVGDDIWSNVYLTDYIMRIDKTTGTITGVVDASGLLTEEEYAALESGQVLNGIAYDPENDVFFITGKDWSKLFEVRFIPVE
jgi:glutaminyl-peptide cyclotransferase